MIISDPTVPVDTYDDLPLAKAASYPVSGVIARTSWQEGKKSNSAVGYVDMHEVYVGDHQHMATGAFQIAYKGPLTEIHHLSIWLTSLKKTILITDIRELCLIRLSLTEF